MKRYLIRTLVCICAGLELALAGCSSTHFNLPPGAIGNQGRYNYSPSIIEQGNTRQFWWCSSGTNPQDPAQVSDAIYYASMNVSTKALSHPVLVLAESPGTWDAVYTCNPKVIGGVFNNPLNDGQTYTYAMYYVATSSLGGINNSIGVAFSNDGIHWKKYPSPVIPTTGPDGYEGYGVGQPALYNADHKSAIRMFYEDSYPSWHHVAAVSSDGVHFTQQGTLTSAGLDTDNPNALWGDMSYDSQTQEWYAIFNRPWRPKDTTGGVTEYGQYGVEMYKIPASAIVNGSSPWQQLITVDTNSTGLESNFIAGFVRDMWGNVSMASYPTIRFYTSVSYPAPNWRASPAAAGDSGQQDNWIIYPMSWSPAQNGTLPLNRFFTGKVHEVTTGWVDPSGGFKLEELLGHLEANSTDRANVPWYGCKAGTSNYFISLDVNCEGARILGKVGYGYGESGAGQQLIPLYRCSSAVDHFVSKDPKCEGQKTDMLLGYAAP
jgi:hypothetical protein